MALWLAPTWASEYNYSVYHRAGVGGPSRASVCPGALMCTEG